MRTLNIETEATDVTGGFGFRAPAMAGFAWSTAFAPSRASANIERFEPLWPEPPEVDELPVNGPADHVNILRSPLFSPAAPMMPPIAFAEAPTAAEDGNASTSATSSDSAGGGGDSSGGCGDGGCGW